jgi:hypothetical protein
MVTVAGADGTPYYRGRVTAESPQVTFEAQPGEVELLLSIQGPDAEVLDSETREITVPDLGSGTAVGTPRLYRARTARALQDIRANPDALPTIEREFSRAERLLIRVAAYAADGSPPAVAVKLLNRMGTAMSDLKAEPEAGGRSAIEVPLAGLAPGDYLVEIKASASGGESTELVAFRVG